MLLRIVLLVLITIFALVILAGQWGLLRGKPPSHLGVKDGKLKPPSKTPNSVSSQADLYPEHAMRAYAQIEPIRFTGEPALAWNKLVKAVSSLPRTSIVVNQTDTEPKYLYAQCTTWLLRFTDDLEFTMDESAKVIHVRSSSRLGRKDFGVNRKRIEALRQSFTASLP